MTFQALGMGVPPNFACRNCMAENDARKGKTLVKSSMTIGSAFKGSGTSAASRFAMIS